MPVIAETNRLNLRHFENDDLESLYEIMSDARVMKHSVSGPLTRSEAETFLNNILDTYKTKGYSLWAVESKAHGCLIGFCGHFFHRLNGADEVELAYRLHPDFWGQGMASEAARAAAQYAFSELGLNRLISFISQKNLASIKVAENSGFSLESEVRFLDIPVLVYSRERKE